MNYTRFIAVFAVIKIIFPIMTNAQIENQMTSPKQTVVFIHGLFMNSSSWNEWMNYFKDRGYNCLAPSYPFHEGDPVHLRKDISNQLGYLTLGQIVDHYIGILSTLKDPPILVGHSMGGLVVQILINRGYGLKGICIDSAPPKGVFTFKWSFLKNNLATVNPIKGNSPCLPSEKWFRAAFCNTMTLADTEKIYAEMVVPESRNIPRKSIGRQGKIDFNKAHNPLLFIAGEKDTIIPWKLNLKNAGKYAGSGGTTDFKKFEGRTHIICAQENWEEVADYVLDWLRK